MRIKKVHSITIKSLALLVAFGTSCLTMAQESKTAYRSMAPIEQYLMDRTAEIALARSAAPESISGKKELPAMEPGGMCYMMSKQGYGGDSVEHWPPHLMFYFSQTDPAIWGANLQGSPIIAVSDTREHVTTFVIALQRWSDGTEGRLVTRSHGH